MLSGSLVAIVTPMLADGALDLPSLKSLIDWHVQEGTDGIVIVGTTGESPTVDVDEHAGLIKSAVEFAAGRIPVIAGTGGNSTKEAIELTKHAKKVGAQYSLSVVPYYNKPMQEGLYQHFRAIAEACDLPMILYNVPSRTIADLANDTILRLAQVPGIVGIKEATSNIERVSDLLKRKPKDFIVFSGDDITALSYIMLGARGVISVTANVAPRPVHEMCVAGTGGDFNRAIDINNHLDVAQQEPLPRNQPDPGEVGPASHGPHRAGDPTAADSPGRAAPRDACRDAARRRLPPLKQGSRFMKQPHALLLAAVFLLGGCGLFGKKNEEFKAGLAARKPLEVPPELTAPGLDDRFAIPDPRIANELLAYQQRANTPAPATGPDRPRGASADRGRAHRARRRPALARRERAPLKRSGRACTISGSRPGGRSCASSRDRHHRDRLARGPLQDPRRHHPRTVGKWIDGMYSTSTRDKYRTRLEKGAEPGTTEVYVTHRGVEEVFTTKQEDATKWQPRPNNREYEAEMLQRIMVKLGAPEATKVAAASGAPLSGSPNTVDPRNAVIQGNSLVVNDNFDRAWRRVGLALDRSGFTVEDRDRSKGVFFVRYIDPDADLQSGKKKEGFWESLKFWKSDPNSKPSAQYRIHVGDAGGGPLAGRRARHAKARRTQLDRQAHPHAPLRPAEVVRFTASEAAAAGNASVVECGRTRS
jgi:4-hydroxy-tetrahydrodipicolinate synthase